MLFQELLEKKRDCGSLTQEEIRFIVNGYTNGDIPDYQVSAWLMAVFINGLSADETVWLTESMLHSGVVVDLSSIDGIKVDKHSTGGVGDKTSLIVAPICAALRIPVPMISGRGLGHTGGTLDKLESIPGFQVDLGLATYRRLVAKHHLCLIGQTKEIAPADKKLYSLRDVTCTVENRSLISASIMSKKLAEGIDALVLDVKAGKGAFMKSREEAEKLASVMITIGRQMGKKVTALVTNMDSPLGRCVGNALEVMECVEILNGSSLPEQTDLIELSLTLASHMIVLGGKAEDLESARKLALKSIEDGSAFEKLKAVVREQGGDPESLSDLSRLPTATITYKIKAAESGFMESLDALSVAKGALSLGAGRQTMKSVIDHAVGVRIRKKPGDAVKSGETLLEIEANSARLLDAALPHFESSFSIRPDRVEKPESIFSVLK